MTRVLALAGLLALQFVLGNCDEETTLTLRPGGIMELKAKDTYEKVTKCLIARGTNEPLEFFPKNEFASYDGNGKSCVLVVRDIPLSYAGVWTMETFTETQNFKTKFIVKMNQHATMRPTNHISAAAGQFATVWVDPEEDSDLKACTLKMPERGEINLLTEKVDNITRTNGCGVQVLLTENMDTEWTFTAHFGEYLIKTATMKITVFREQEYTEMTHEQFNIGESGSLQVHERGVSLCQFTRPDGAKLPFVLPYLLGGCVYKIPSFNAYHDGVWTVSFSKSDMMKRMYVKINVTVNDPNFMEFSSTYGVGNSVNLMCRSGTNNLKFCTFIRPDKEVINVPVGIGNKKYISQKRLIQHIDGVMREGYSYHGQGYDDRDSMNRRYSECGLTIHNPSNVDFGLWTCQMGVNGGIRGGVINVENTRMARRVSRIASPKVFVKRGDEFTIRCSANAVLNYCWLTDPSGSMYSVSPAEGSGKSLKYNGKGLTMGECGAIVKNASDTHNGEWTCHLGIDNGVEIEGTVSVKVTDTYLIPVEETVYAERRPTLSSRTFRDDEGTLQYCRWVRPNGHGINEEDASRYQFTKGVRDCSLTILSPASDDIGQWRCVASLTGNSGKEEWSTIELRPADENDGTSIASILSIVLGSGLLVIILIGAFFATMHFYKKRNARLSKTPPPYCPQDYAIPHGIQTGPPPVIESKDYVY